MSVIYLTSWYEDKNPSRQQELLSCLRKVVYSGEVDRVHLLTEAALPFEDEKLTSEVVQKRPTYNDFFDAGNRIGKPGDVIIVANTDIYPSQGVRAYLETIGPQQCYALSRWDEDTSGRLTHFARKDSQDIWVFRYPIAAGVNGEFNLGKGGCDNRIAHEIKQGGYKVTNPSKTIVFHHLHNSNVRNYISGVDSVEPPYHRVEPTHLIHHKPRQVSCSMEKVTGVLHVGFSQPPLERAFAKEFKQYKFIKWTDYQKNPQDLRDVVYKEYLTGHYQLVFFHVQTVNIITPDLIKAMKEAEILMDPLFVNWTGDVRTPLPSWYTTLGKELTMTLFSNETDMLEAREKGINAEYLQIGFDTEFFSPGQPKAVWPEIVFMGNNYPSHFPLSDHREEMVDKLQARYGKRFGLYGNGWKNRATGTLMGKEAEEADCYRGCKVAINLSHFDYERYSSDRIFRIMGSGAFCLTHRYKGITKDFIPGTNVAAWDNLDHLMHQIDFYLESETNRKMIAESGCKLVHSLHTWDNRVQELKRLLNL